MASYSDHDLWAEEQLILAEKRENSPQELESPSYPRKYFLERIGITEDFPEFPRAVIKYSPLDFIVEEILLDGRIVLVDSMENDAAVAVEGQGTVYVDLIKVGISTLVAIERIADNLKVEASRIGYAGIKDAAALTGQVISIRGVGREAISQLSVPGVIFRNPREGKGVMTIGALKGNRFTLFIRTEKEFPKDKFMAEIEKISQKGVMNYYGAQRFGAPRFLSHLFGLYLFQGDIPGLMKSYLTETSPFEWSYVTNLRRKAAASYGDWKTMREIYRTLPYTFRVENILLDELIKIGSNNFTKAFNLIPKQIDIWAKAYASYLANRILSEMAKGERRAIEDLPLALSQGPESRSLYYEYLREDGAENFIQNLKKFSFIHIGRSSSMKSLVYPAFRGVEILPEGIAISFDLPKGAYATTILMHLFDSPNENIIPEWMSRKEFDTKKILKLGSLENIRESLGEYINQIINAKEKPPSEL